MKKIIVTGATGFLGKHVVKELQKRDVDVKGILSEEHPIIIN